MAFVSSAIDVRWVLSGRRRRAPQAKKRAWRALNCECGLNLACDSTYSFGAQRYEVFPLRTRHTCMSRGSEHALNSRLRRHLLSLSDRRSLRRFKIANALFPHFERAPSRQDPSALSANCRLEPCYLAPSCYSTSSFMCAAILSRARASGAAWPFSNGRKHGHVAVNLGHGVTPTRLLHRATLGCCGSCLRERSNGSFMPISAAGPNARSMLFQSVLSQSACATCNWRCKYTKRNHGW